MNLHPEVEKEIEAGPQSICDHYVEHIPVMRNESLEEFARRIAQIAMEEEREECAKVVDKEAADCLKTASNPAVRPDIRASATAAGRKAQNLAATIRRGKP